MRLVSVVVPLWLMATASVSDMSRRSPNPDSSVAVTASTSKRAGAELVEHGGHRLPGHGGRPLTDDAHPPDRAGGQALGHGGRQRPWAEDGVAAQRPVGIGALVDPAAQRLGQALGGLGDLLEQEVRSSPRSMSRVVTSARTTSAADTGCGDPS